MSEDLKKMTFSEHIEELRTRIAYSIVAVVIAFVVCFCFRDKIVEMVVSPYESFRTDYNAEAQAEGNPELAPLVFIGPTEAFVFYIKACIFAAVLLTAPFLLFHMWRFIGAGLYKKERKAVMRIMPVSCLLFLAGMAFGYFVLFPFGLSFLVTFADPHILQASITVGKYFSLFCLLILVMGFVFQTPLIMVVTTTVELTTPRFFSTKRKYFILGAFVVSALLTPPDWITQCLLAGPLIVLFEVGIVLSRGVMKRKGEKEEPEGEDDTPSVSPRAG